MHRGDTEKSDVFGKAELINQQFVSVFQPKRLTDVLPSPPEDTPRLDTVSCSVEDVFSCLAHTRPKVATGPDDISSMMLRSTAHIIAPPLTCIFNQSLQQGVFPTCWKSSNITPIYKSGDPSDVSNYRPISLLSLISKSLERLVHNKIMEHLVSNKLLSSIQFGFRPEASTTEAVLSVTRECHQALEHGNSAACVFFDVSKAFDSLAHDLILESLARVGLFAGACLLGYDHICQIGLSVWSCMDQPLKRPR